MNEVIQGDALEVLKTLPDESVQTCITSPPYFGLRDYGVNGQIGMEESPDAYVQKLVQVFREVKRVLQKDGTLWLNLGDSYTNRGTIALQPKKAPPGYKQKDLFGIPWMVAFALRTDGWYLRQDIIWAKPNPMPESVTDRCTKSHEYIFLLAKSQKYYYDNKAIKEPMTSDRPDMAQKGIRTGLAYLSQDKIPSNDRKKYERTHAAGGTNIVGHNGNRKANGEPFDFVISGTRNKRDVWTVPTKPYREAHFATYPEDLVEPMILAGSPTKGVVLDPFAGSGTTLAVAKRLNRQWLGIELSEVYIELAKRRIASSPTPML